MFLHNLWTVSRKNTELFKSHFSSFESRSLYIAIHCFFHSCSISLEMFFSSKKKKKKNESWQQFFYSIFGEIVIHLKVVEMYYMNAVKNILFLLTYIQTLENGFDEDDMSFFYNCYTCMHITKIRDLSILIYIFVKCKNWGF